MTLSRTCVEAEPFALQVLDDSMEPEFARGCVVLIDPTGVASDGAFVVVELGAGLVLRQLSRDDGEMRLLALNRRYSSELLSAGIAAIKGVVVQRAGRRRCEHKRYY